jgi:DNA-binding CsgD family transcriptional regulator
MKTVDTHRRRIKDKLNLKTTAQLARDATQWVLENG